jgi:HD-GYP domain-containing protein (c-di-GMP phosphodiesterase class II)
MRIISLDAVKGDELLAKDIFTANDSLLLPAGTMIKKEYIKRLKELRIDYIYVEDDLSKGVNLVDSLELQIKEQCQEVVRDLLMKYSYHEEGELEDIKVVADDIIHDIMDEPEVIYNLSSIRDKSDITYSHSLNVCALSVILAFKLKLPKSKIREIAIGSLLHDIGLTYINPELYNLNLDTCSEKEQKEIKKHIIYGYSAVEKMDWLSPTAKDIVISHHERLDGSGYPFHIKEDRIKLGSRIVAVCDEFDSRVYGNFVTKMKVHDAIDYIVSKAGVLFDLKVVKAFVDSVAAYPTGSMVRTNEGELGIVLRQNPQCPTRPIIRIVEDRDGKKPEGWIEKNLTKELTLFIVDTLDV